MLALPVVRQFISFLKVFSKSSQNSFYNSLQKSLKYLKLFKHHFFIERVSRTSQSKQSFEA